MKKSASAVENSEVTPLSWTLFHIERKRDIHQDNSTINVSLPLIDHKSNTVETQMHLMNNAMKYTEFLNPGQTAVGVSDQPLYALKKKFSFLSQTNITIISVSWVDFTLNKLVSYV